jgi:hypothetical protein
MKPLLAEYKMGGISFFIPCSDAECEFLKDAVPAEPTVDEAIQGIHRLADEISHEAEQHDDWYNNQHAFDELHHIPETYK